MKSQPPLPILDGIKSSYLILPHEPQWRNRLLLDFLGAHFPIISRQTWQQRLAEGKVVNQHGQALSPQSLFQAGSTIYYYRELDPNNEPPIPFRETILAISEHLIAVDKPHFLPVIPRGRFLRETLLTRLRLRPELQHLDLASLTPIHRLDKDTAGVILFSHHAPSRAVYQQLFQRQAISKTYHALAATRQDYAYPLTIASRIIRGEPFFTSQTIAGEANSYTTIQLLQHRGDISLYELHPTTGKKHQLRLHMAQLGMPILNDPLYPTIQPEPTDYSFPLKLLAKRIQFRDPFSGSLTIFESQQTL